LQLVPAIGVQDVLVRELRLECEFIFASARHRGSAQAILAELEW
jgi:hypothetical protein